MLRAVTTTFLYIWGGNNSHWEAINTTIKNQKQATDKKLFISAF